MPEDNVPPQMTSGQIMAGLKNQIAIGRRRRLEELGRSNRDVSELLRAHTELLASAPPSDQTKKKSDK